MDRQEVKRAKTYQLELRFALYLHRQRGEFDFIRGDSPITGQICRVTEDITRTQRPKPGAEDAKGLADVEVGGSERVKVLTDQPEEQEQNSEGVRLKFWTHGSEITEENRHERGRG